MACCGARRRDERAVDELGHELLGHGEEILVGGATLGRFAHATIVASRPDAPLVRFSRGPPPCYRVVRA
jgi:hypothetical protein